MLRVGSAFRLQWCRPQRLPGKKKEMQQPCNEKLEQNELLEKTATARHIIFQHVTCITQGNHVHNYCKYLHSQHCFSALGIGVLSPENICVFRPL